MKYIYIALTLLTLHTIHPMKKCKSGTNLTDLRQPLLDHTDPDDITDISRTPPEKPHWRALPNLKKSACYHQLTEPEQEVTQSYPHESLAHEVRLPEDMQLHTFGQKSCTVHAISNNKELFVHACASRPTGVDFTDIRKHPRWHKPRHQQRHESLKKYELQTLHMAIKGQVEIESLSERRKQECCIFTSCDITTIALNRTGKLLAIAGANDAKNILLIYLLKHGTGSKKLHAFSAPHAPLLLAFSPSDDRILMCCTRNEPEEFGRRYARVFSLVTGQIIMELDGFNDFVHRSELNCGWINEHQIMASTRTESFAWNVPSEPA